MSTPAGVVVPQRPVRRLDRKLSNIAAGRYTPDDFVIADAKDADMAFGVTSAGPVTDAPAGEAVPGRYRTRSEYLGAMRALVAQGELDVILTSAANGERLAQDGSLEDMTLAVRANDSTDIWNNRGGRYIAGALTGVDAPVPTVDGPVDWPGLEAMALGMIERGVSVLAVVHFPAGCVAAVPDGRTWRQGSVRLPREQVRSTTGAGDAFAAGVILGLHEGWPVERCLRLGVASAAASVRSPNTSDGIEAAEACLAEAERAGYRLIG